MIAVDYVMVDILAIISVIITFIFGILSISLSVILALYPDKLKLLIKKISEYYLQFKHHFLSFTNSINYINILIGVVIISLVLSLNEIPTIVNQDSDHIGSEPICTKNYCTYFIPKDHKVYFPLSLKAESSNELKITYASKEIVQLVIGIGDSISDYNYFNATLINTNGLFQEHELFSGKSDKQICQNCFNNYFRKIISILF